MSKKGIEQSISEAKSAWKAARSAAKKHLESARSACVQAEKRALAAEKHLTKAQEAFACRKSTNAEVKAIGKAVECVEGYLIKVTEQARLWEQFHEQAIFTEALMVDSEMELQILREEARRDGFAVDEDMESEEDSGDEEGEEEEEEEEQNVWWARNSDC